MDGASDFSGGIRKWSVSGVVSGLVIGVVAAFILSWPYGFAMRYLTVTPLDMLMAVGFGWILGKVVCGALRKSRIAAFPPALFICLVTGVFAAWFAWLVYFFILGEFDTDFYFHLLANPPELLKYLVYLAHNPVWSLSKGGGGEPTVFYYAVWLGEFGALIVMPILGARYFLRNNKLCPDCGGWIALTGDAAFFAHPAGKAEFDRFRERVFAGTGDLASLLELPRVVPPEDEPGQWLEARGHACANCPDQDGYVRLVSSALVHDKNQKKLVRKDTGIGDFLPVDVAMEKKLFEPADAARGPAAPEEPPPEDGEETRPEVDGERLS